MSSLKSFAGSSSYRDVLNVYDHILDPNERRRLLLGEIDRLPFGWYHVRAVVVAGAGFFTDAYDIFAINLTTAMFGLVYWQHSHGGTIPSDSETAIKVATSAGTVIGQIIFGYAADWLGRKKMYGIELIIILAATLAQSLSASSTALSFVGVTVFWRVVMGIGIGGDYPLSSVITSEFANTRWRGAMIGAVFAMQGFGQFAAAMMTLIVVVAFRRTLESAKTPANCEGECQRSVDIMWRLVIGVGAVPGLFALYYRLTIPETPRYTFDVIHDLDQATANVYAWRSGVCGEGWTDPLRRAQIQQDVERKYHSPQPTYTDLKAYYRKRRNALALVGTAGSWFFLDVAFYGLGLNSSTVLSTIGFGGQENVYRLFYNAAVGNLILVCAGSIPGYWCTVAFADSLGRKTIQILGFTILTLLFAIIGFDFNNLSEGSLLAMYVLCQFFFNFGPNATTFIIPAECFPTRFRATAHGFSAAAGKVGAVIAQVVFAPMAKRGHNAHSKSSAPWLNHVMQVFALFMLCGILTSILVPETRRETLEKLADGEEGVDHFELNFVERFFTPAGRATLRDRNWHIERGRWWSWQWWSERKREKLEQERLKKRNGTLERARVEGRWYLNIERPVHD